MGSFRTDDHLDHDLAVDNPHEDVRLVHVPGEDMYPAVDCPEEDNDLENEEADLDNARHMQDLEVSKM